MPVYPDLSEYSYVPGLPPMLNVGWLGSESDFRRGPVATDVVDALIVLASDLHNIMRGLQDCAFCEVESPVRMPAPVPRGWVSLGTGELHIPSSSGIIFAAPSLVIHYIVDHEYVPPQSFLHAAIDFAAPKQ